MQKKIGLALLGIRISSVIYSLIAVGCVVGWFMLPSGSEMVLSWGLWLLAVFALAIVIFLEIVIVNLKRRRFWAWVAGIIVGGLYAPSLFLPFGVMILVGLLSADSRMAFGVGTIPYSEPPSASEGADRASPEE
jgi:hypothetical protein